jgi:hypothetical protein
MKFQELMAIADFTEKHQLLVEKNSVTCDTISKAFDAKKKRLVDTTFDEFNEYFKKFGFRVLPGEESTTVDYKTLRISLKSEEPGRRKDDVQCLLRFLLVIDAVPNETFSIFIRWANNVPHNEPGSPMSAGTPPEIIQTGRELQEQTDNLSKLISSIKESINRFEIRKHKNVLEILIEKCEQLHESTQTEIQKWNDIQKDRYTFILCEGGEEQICEYTEQHPSLSKLLDHLDLLL